MLIEIDECIFDEEEFRRSGGTDSFRMGALPEAFFGIDAIGIEAFVNHIHYDETDRVERAGVKIAGWIQEMKAKWPHRKFRIYKHIEPTEITVRFHLVRDGIPNWCNSGVEIIDV